MKSVHNMISPAIGTWVKIHLRSGQKATAQVIKSVPHISHTTFVVQDFFGTQRTVTFPLDRIEWAGPKPPKAEYEAFLAKHRPPEPAPEPVEPAVYVPETPHYDNVLVGVIGALCALVVLCLAMALN